jgi:NAD dependent epimerase/dehydratase family enzyme
LSAPSVSGPVNLTAPEPTTNAEFTRALGAVLHRPTVLPTPLLALKAVYGGELVDTLLVRGQRVLPPVLEASGYAFGATDIESALRAVVAAPAAA